MCSIIYIYLFVTNCIFANAYYFVDDYDFDFTPLNDNGRPLFLTPYISSGMIEAAREDSKVGNFEGVPYIPSHSGFLTVNQEYNSNIFFWFFPARNGDKKAPVILWLQGGPGASGLMGLFLENGPYVVYPNTTLGLRELSWIQTFNMIYVDNPVGSGFSFTGNEKGYSTNQEEIVDNLYEFLQQFFTVFYEYRDNDFYISGESYGGKHAPSLAYRIHTTGPTSKINLKGITVGNGFTFPVALLDNPEVYYQLGLLDYHQTCELRTHAQSILQKIRNNEFEKALDLLSYFVPNFDGHAEPFLKKYAGYTFVYNMLYTDIPKEYTYFYRFIQLPQFRKATHIGNLLFRGEDAVKKYLRRDIMKSLDDQAVVVMNNYKVLYYHGGLDLSIPITPVAEFLRNFQWKSANEYRRAKRKIWKVNENEVAGYVRNVGSFFHVLVLGAGHLVPHDKPIQGFDLISRFINDTLISRLS